ncbi:ATP-dependent DNA helicase RecG [Roseovarius sp. TE539]|nr:ATP-dependent DNA helicase RecG [Roseovarius sp. TE539]
MAETKKIEAREAQSLLERRESHFLDFKAKEAGPAKLTKAVSAFANSAGGELIIGIEEVENLSGGERIWSGFADEEDANGLLQTFASQDPLGNIIQTTFIECQDLPGIVLFVTIQKSQQVLMANNGKAYVRKGAQSLPVSGDALDRLKFDKGVVSYEDEKINTDYEEVTNSETIIEFLIDTVPTGEPVEWLEKQRLLVDNQPTVASVLLYSDTPQSLLPKRSAVKILRYRTKDDAERDYLAGNPETIEGPIYHLIYNAVARVREVIEGIEKLGPEGMEKISYPEEALHELLTNAVLHRDYSIPSDVQVRIFDNRIEIESPGQLPGHVSIQNIERTQFARNPKIVRLVVGSRKVVWPFPEQVGLEFVPVFHRLQGRLAAQG